MRKIVVATTWASVVLLAGSVGGISAPTSTRAVESAQAPSDQDRDMAKLLNDLAEDLRDMDMIWKAKAFETAAGKIASQPGLTSEDVDAIKKEAAELSALAATYETVKPDEAYILRRISQRLTAALKDVHVPADPAKPTAARLSDPAPSSGAPGSKGPPKSGGAEVTVSLSLRTIPPPRPPKPPAAHAGAAPPVTVPPPPPIRQLQIRIVGAPDTFNNGEALLSHLTAKFGEKLEGLTVKIEVSNEVTCGDLRNVVQALASDSKIAGIQISNLPLRGGGQEGPEPPSK